MKCLVPFLILFLLIELGVNAQSPPKDIFDKLNVIGRSGIFQDRPGSQKELKEILYSNPGMADSLKGVALTTLAIGYGMNNQADSAIYYLKMGIPLLPENDRKVRAIKNMGNCYAQIGAWGKADSTYRKALSMADKIGNQSSKAIIIGELATLQGMQYNFEDATRLALEAISIDQKNGESGKKHLLQMRIKMANFELNMGNNDFALREFKAVQSDSEKVNNPLRFYTTSVSIGHILINTAKYQEAYPYFNEALSYFEKTGNLEMVGYITFSLGLNSYKQGDLLKSLGLLGKAYSLLHQVHSYRLAECAVYYLNCLEKEKKFDVGLAILANKELSDLLQQSSVKIKLEFKKAALPFLKYQNKSERLIAEQQAIIKLSEQLDQEQNDRTTLEMQAKYRIEETERQNKQLVADYLQLDKRNKVLKGKYYLWIICALFVIILISYMGYRFYLRAYRHWEDLEIHKNRNKKLSEKVNLELDRGKIKDAIIDQQMVSIMSHNDEVEKLRNEQKEIKSEKKERLLKLLFNQLDNIKDGKENRKHFIAKFNIIFPDFTSRLLEQYSELSTSDLQYCALIRLNLSNKNIAQILNVELASLYKKRSRLMEKMKISPNNSLENILMEIS